MDLHRRRIIRPCAVRFATAGVMTTLLMAGCADVTGVPESARPAFSIADAPRGGTPGFYWLSPMVPTPAWSGTFDADLAPRVEVCERGGDDGCGATVVVFTPGGSGPESVRLSEADEHYAVNWQTGRHDVDLDVVYRVRVVVTETRSDTDVVLGHADVRFGRNARALRDIDAASYIGVVQRTTLPIRFRIETGVPATLAVGPAEVELHAGGTHQFPAALFGLHGESLAGAVAWSSDEEAVVTIDDGGLATAVGPGTAGISATSGGITATVTVTVAAAEPEEPEERTWQPLGDGLPHSSVGALTVFQGDLIGGAAAILGGGPAPNRWTGSTWEAVGHLNAGIRAMAVYDGDLYVAGFGLSNEAGQSLQTIARWDGTGWHGVGGGTNGQINALVVWNGDLIAAGSFLHVDGRPIQRIARWDGTEWHPLGTGVDLGIFALTIHDGDLIAAGNFTIAGGLPAGRIARWDGVSWQPLAPGPAARIDNGAVTALAVYNGQIIAGGNFTFAGGASANRIARWDGTAWHAMGHEATFAGIVDPVRALTVYQGQVLAGGCFRQIFGDFSRCDIASWDGADWGVIGGGFNGQVMSLATHDGDLIAGGQFTLAGGQPALNVARGR